jgi:hypothetical protein
MEIYIRRPYTIIDRIYNEEFISGKGKAGENWLRKVSLAFGEKLVSEDLLNSVPRLGPQSIPGTLVRVSGIVHLLLYHLHLLHLEPHHLHFEIHFLLLYHRKQMV